MLGSTPWLDMLLLLLLIINVSIESGNSIVIGVLERFNKRSENVTGLLAKTRWLIHGEYEVFLNSVRIVVLSGV